MHLIQPKRVHAYGCCLGRPKFAYGLVQSDALFLRFYHRRLNLDLVVGRNRMFLYSLLLCSRMSISMPSTFRFELLGSSVDPVSKA